MSALAALARARTSGLTLTAEGERIRWRGPQPSPELMAELRARKAELLALLGPEPAELPEQDAPLSLAVALLAAAERGAAAVAGTADGIEAAEAICALAELPAPKPPESHRAHVRALMDAALRRPPSWSDPAAIPSPGSRCSCCHGAAWSTEAERPSGWRCSTCHPPVHLQPEQIREVRT